MALPPRLRHPQWRPSLRRLYERREIKRLRSLPRYESTCTRLLGPPLHVVDAISFLVSLHEIFQRQVYRFVSRREHPVILDCGANIGLATIYWKQLYPRARILAFEPDPAIFAALQQNCRGWQLSGVETARLALWTCDGHRQFWPEGAHGGRLLAEDTTGANPQITVRTTRLRDRLQPPIDLLKLDIEGAETDVLLDCADRLTGVDHLFVEYHSFVEHAQRLDELLGAMRSAGFRVHVQPQLVSPCPFVSRLNVMGMDQALNIFAYRGNTECQAPLEPGG